MTATFTMGEKEMLQNDMKQLTKNYYDALKRIKKLVEQVEELKNEVESLKEDKVELQVLLEDTNAHLCDTRYKEKENL